MINYESITHATPKDLAIFLDGFNRDKIIDVYCRRCPKKKEGSCPMNYGEPCKIENAEMIMWWLNQPAERGNEYA